MFVSENPQLAAQWHPKNELNPDKTTTGSDKKVWWTCEKGHEWESRVKSRRIAGCPVCAGKTILPGFNDLTTTHPELIKLWNFPKNTIDPTTISVSNAPTPVWWICDQGHEWKIGVWSQHRRKTPCVVCERIRITGLKEPKTLVDSKKFVPFYELVPELLPQVSPKNVVNIENLVKTSSKELIWVCEKGHETVSSVRDRITKDNKATTCEICHLNENNLATIYPQLLTRWNYTKNKLSPEKIVSSSTQKIVWWECEEGHEWEAPVYTQLNLPEHSGCPVCNHVVSAAENEVNKFITDLNLNLATKSGVILNGEELDIYVPEKNIAIEFNSLYWHSENQGKGKYYHHNKWETCKNMGIQLIQVWEDDWYRNPKLVKRMIAHKLGVSSERKVYARATVAKEITQTESNSFLNNYHIQGAVDGGIRIGLFEKNTGGTFSTLPVAVMVLKREPGTDGKSLNLLRYATNVQAVGAFTKILKHVEKTYNPESIITFSDNTVSDGGLYENNGFEVSKILKPDYMYVAQGRRVHKFSYRLKRFREDPELLWDENLSERELALLNNLPRIWDAGKTRWVKTIQN